MRFVENDALERFGHKKFLPYHKIFIKDTIYSDNLGNLEFVDFDLNEDLEYYVLVYNDTVYSFLHSIEVGKSNEFQILIDDLGFLKLSFYNDTNEYWAMSNEIYNYAINKFCLLDSNLIDTTLIFGLIPGTCKLTTCFYKSVIADTMIFETVEIIQNDTLELSYHY